MNINRRHVLIGAGALALSNCSDKNIRKAQPFDPNDRLRFMSASVANGNIGDDPWKKLADEIADEPAMPMITFSPNYIAVLHLDVQASPFRLYAKRAHFPIDTTADNDLGGVSTRVVEVIKHFNDPINVSRPSYVDPNMIKNGLRGLGFTRPHHFIIYMKNQGVRYYRYPVIFGEKLLDPHPNGGYNADPNRTFFESQLSPSYQIGAGVADKFLYVKNYFYTADETNDELIPERRRLITNEKVMYSMNINAIIESSDSNPIGIPIVIDPDTGNMGGGGGGALP